MFVFKLQHVAVCICKDTAVHPAVVETVMCLFAYLHAHELNIRNILGASHLFAGDTMENRHFC